MSINNLSAEQQQCMNRIVLFIARKNLDSVHPFLMSPSNVLGEERSNKILAIISAHQSNLAEQIRACKREQDAYDILLLSPRPHPPVQNSISCEPFFNGSIPTDVLNIIFFYLGSFQNISNLRLVNRHFSQVVIPPYMTLLWEQHTSFPHKGFQIKDAKTSLFYCCASIQSNIFSGRFKFHTFSDPTNEKGNYVNMHIHNNQLAVVDRSCGYGGYRGINLWNIEQRRMWKQIVSPKVRLVKIHDHFIYTAGKKNITIWNLKKGVRQRGSEIYIQTEKHKERRFAVHNDKINDIQVDSHLIYSSSMDHTIKICDSLSGNICNSFSYNESAVSKIFVEGDQIYGLTSNKMVIWDHRSAHFICSSAVAQKHFSSHEGFLSFDKNNHEIYLGTNRGKILVWDSRMSTVRVQSKTPHNNCISHLASDGNFLFAQSSISKTFEEDKEIVEVFEKKEGRSIQLLKETSPSHKILGAREAIRGIQMHRGILYTISDYYQGGDEVIRHYVGGQRATIKAWDFTLPQDDKSCVIL